MSHTPHELTEEFPHLQEKLHALKSSNAHFARLADSYHEINRQIHRAETNVEPLEQLKEVEKISSRYKRCLDAGKTERESVSLAVDMAKAAGYRDLAEYVKENVVWWGKSGEIGCRGC